VVTGHSDAAACRALEQALADLGVEEDVADWSLADLCDRLLLATLKVRAGSAALPSAQDADLRRRLEGLMWPVLGLESDPRLFSNAEMAKLLTNKVRNLQEFLGSLQQFAAAVAHAAGDPLEPGFFTDPLLTAPCLRDRLGAVAHAVVANAAAGQPPPPRSALPSFVPTGLGTVHRSTRASSPPNRPTHRPGGPTPWQMPSLDPSDPMVRPGDRLERELVAALSDLQRADVGAQRLARRLGPEAGRLHSQAGGVVRDVAEARDRLDDITDQLQHAPRLSSRDGSRKSTPTRSATEGRIVVDSRVPEYRGHIFFHRTRDDAGARPPSSSGRSRSQSPTRSGRSASPGRPSWR
jgi:hypothetical protein